MLDENLRDVKEIIIIKLFNCFKVCHKIWIEVNYLSSRQFFVNKKWF